MPYILMIFTFIAICSGDEQKQISFLNAFRRPEDDWYRRVWGAEPPRMCLEGTRGHRVFVKVVEGMWKQMVSEFAITLSEF